MSERERHSITGSESDWRGNSTAVPLSPHSVIQTQHPETGSDAQTCDFSTGTPAVSFLYVNRVMREVNQPAVV